MIEGEFDSILGNSSKYYWFSASMLNDSASDINTAIKKGNVPEPGYLFATLVASNATDSNNSTDSGSTTSSSDSGTSPNPGNTNTSLAMYVLLCLFAVLVY